MLDIKFIRENAEKVQTSAEAKGYQVNLTKLLELDENRRELQREVDAIRERRNAIAAKMKGGKPEQNLIAEGKNNTELGEALFLSESTVQTHVGRVLSKLQTRDRVHAVIFAKQHGL